MKPSKHADKLLAWTLKHWYRIGMLGCAVYLCYSVHVAVSRFLAFTWFLFQAVEELQKSGTLS